MTSATVSEGDLTVLLDLARREAEIIFRDIEGVDLTGFEMPLA